MAVAKQRAGVKALSGTGGRAKGSRAEEPVEKAGFSTDLLRLIADGRLSDALPLAVGSLQARQQLGPEEVAAVLHLLRACSERMNEENPFLGMEREGIRHSDQLASIFGRMIGLLREQGEQIAVLNGIVAELA